LQSKIPTSGFKNGVEMSYQNIIFALREVHVVDNPQFEKFWPPLRDYMKKLIKDGKMPKLDKDGTLLIIPD
jgi:hypothetical protein